MSEDTSDNVESATRAILRDNVVSSPQQMQMQNPVLSAPSNPAVYHSAGDFRSAREIRQSKIGYTTVVDTFSYYARYDGHPSKDLEIIENYMRQIKRDGLIFLSGDSSLDNKFWFGNRRQAVNGYEEVLSPPSMKTDVNYWLNYELEERQKQGIQGSNMASINTAIEATSLATRGCCTLLVQDKFIRDHITSKDILIVSVGGNDIALMPTLMTIVNILSFSWCIPTCCIKNCACVIGPPNILPDLGCYCCSLERCLQSFLCGWPPTFGYFVDLFKTRVENYVRRLISGAQKPKKVIVCMIYFLDEIGRGGWADCALSCMCYNCKSSHLQQAIKSVFQHATSKIKIEGTEVVAFPLFRVLDGKNSDDYLERVEPSPQGGRKMGKALIDCVLFNKIPEDPDLGMSGYDNGRSGEASNNLSAGGDVGE